MKRFTVIFVSLILWLFPSFLCAGQVDSSRLAALDERLEEYFRTLEPERIEVKNDECDLLISSAKDSLLRRHIALKIYDHYLESPVMGDEAVAIHLTDKWFAPGLIDMGGDEVLLNAKVYADFNRQSLLGMPAPSVVMETPEGERIEICGHASRYRVLFFYDTDCSKCKLETALLRAKLNARDWPIDVYAIYTGADPDSWREWRQSKFEVRAAKTKVIHLWDPEVTSDYQMKYGVLQTPRMFLLDRSGTIIGRGMDTRALDQLLGIVLADAAYEYGGQASVALMDKLFASYDDAADDDAPDSLSRVRPNWSLSLSKRISKRLPKCPDTARILSMANALENRTLAKGDTLFFKQLEGDLLYWLTSRRDELSKEGTLPFINEYVLSRPEIWNTSDDTLKVVGLARMMKELLSRTPVGSKLPNSKELISGVANTASIRCWTKDWDRLRRKGGYIVFHTEGCPVCKTELAAADSLDLRTLDVNVDEIMTSNPDLAKVLLDTFDLSSMPFIIEVGRHGVIRRRYVSFLSGRCGSASSPTVVRQAHQPVAEPFYPVAVVRQTHQPVAEPFIRSLWFARLTNRSLSLSKRHLSSNAPQHPGQLIRAGGPAPMTVDTGQDFNCLAGIHAFQKPSDRLKVSVTPFDVMKVVDLAVNEVKVNLCRADKRARNRRYMSDTIRRFVRQYLKIITYGHSSNY